MLFTCRVHDIPIQIIVYPHQERPDEKLEKPNYCRKEKVMETKIRGMAIALSTIRKERDELKQQNEVLLRRVLKANAHLAEATDCIKELNEEGQSLYKELQATKEAVRYWGNTAEKRERTIKAMKEELDKTKNKLGSYKLLAGILEDICRKIGADNQIMAILLDLRSQL